MRSAWRLDLPYILTQSPTIKHVRMMLPVGGAAMRPNLELEVTLSISWSQTVLGSGLGSLLDRKPPVVLAVSQKQTESDRVTSS